MSQDLRERALKNFREHKAPVLIATDVLSRGIDIKDLDYVCLCDKSSCILGYQLRFNRQHLYVRAPNWPHGAHSRRCCDRFRRSEQQSRSKVCTVFARGLSFSGPHN